jgi:hypothetical protein
VYRHHKAFGATVIAATLTFLVVSLRELYSDPRLIHWMSERLGSAGARVAIVTVGALAVILLVFGVFLLVRPSALKGVESVANRWIAPPPFPREEFVNRIVLRMPRLTALLLLASGTICLYAERY